jgi:hypothetical protein
MGDSTLALIGSSMAISGSIISVAGALINNLKHDHRRAMRLWMVSNIMLLAWSAGFISGLWNGGVSVGALMAMYLIFSISNFWGLTHV